MRDNAEIFMRFGFLLLITVFISLAVGGYFTYLFLQPAEPEVLQADILWEKSLAAVSGELARLNAVQKNILAKEKAILELISELEAGKANVTNSEEAEVKEEEKEKEQATISLRLLPGDNIWTLVSRFIDSPSKELIGEILEINNIRDPKKLNSGARIVLPIKKITTQ